MRVLEHGVYRVYIYPNDCQTHHLPHCHVRRKNEDEAVVILPTMEVLFGEINNDLLQVLLDNLDYLCNKWDELNPDC